MSSVILRILIAHCVMLILRKCAHASMFDRCPMECSCNGTAVVCTGMKKTEFPTYLPRNMETLEIRNSDFEDIPQNVLSGFSALKSLKLSTSSVKYIHTCAFSGPHQIAAIRFHNVSITEIVQNGFHHLQNVQEIEFRNSDISRIASYAFNNLKNMRSLKFQNLTVASMGSSAINNITNVTNLKIMDSKFTSLSPRPITHLRQVDFTGISRNVFSSVVCDIERMFNTGRFRFSDNQLPCLCNMPFFRTTGGQILGALGEIITFSNNTCGSPPDLKGRFVTDIDHDALCDGVEGTPSPDDLCPSAGRASEVHSCHAFGMPLIPPDSEVQFPTTAPPIGASNRLFTRVILLEVFVLFIFI